MKRLLTIILAAPVIAYATPDFNALDTNKDGFLSAQEIRKLDIEIDDCDENEDGKLSREEFLNCD